MCMHKPMSHHQETHVLSEEIQKKLTYKGERNLRAVIQKNILSLLISITQRF